MRLYTGTNKLNETMQIVNLHSEDSKFVSIQFQDSEILYELQSETTNIVRMIEPICETKCS